MERSSIHLWTFQTPFITLRDYYRDVIEQQVNFLIHYESDCGYKGHNIAYASGDFVVLYSRTSLIRPSNLRAPPTGHYISLVTQNEFPVPNQLRAYRSQVCDLCKLSIQHATTVFTQSAPSGFTPFWLL